MCTHLAPHKSSINFHKSSILSYENIHSTINSTVNPNALTAMKYLEYFTGQHEEFAKSDFYEDYYELLFLYF